MKHGLYLFIAATLHSENQQTKNRSALMPKQALVSKKIFFVYIKKTKNK